ncbi:membrane bound O-acyl transferase family-domain-containing protein [Mycena galopus ATCC 62051]|nr:membrane bound O-acyl transferase family-domain-containing protein [Mycena galopus ATCC 62051]
MFNLNQRSPLTLASFFHTYLAPWVLYYLTNVLAILGPATFFYRLALLPVTLFMIYRAAVSLDVASAFAPTDPGSLAPLNHILELVMFTVFARSLARTFSSRTPQRLHQRAMTINQLALDAVDLTLNLRVIGWNLSAGMKMTAPTRPQTTSAYLAATAGSLAIYFVLLDFVDYSCQLLLPPAGGSIYDPTISSTFSRHLHATPLTILVGVSAHACLQIGGDVCALIGVGLLGQSPSQWPPLFNKPWLSTSLSEFWSARWHQLFRQDFLALGARPFGRIAGRPGSVFGAFLVSGTLHYVGLWGMGRGTDVRIIYFFLMMGVGGILEGFWKRLTGQRVGGLIGWMWSCMWILSWGRLIADPWCIGGMTAGVLVPPTVRPSVWLQKLALTAVVDAGRISAMHLI